MMRGEKLSNFRIITSLLGSGHAAVMLVDVETLGRTKYTDVQQTGIGRYRTNEEAIQEAKQWAESEEIPYVPGGRA